jgi:bile acid:Na+ symporter, BASS family
MEPPARQTIWRAGGQQRGRRRPDDMELKDLIVLALKISIIGTVLGFGLKATVDDLLYVIRRPSLLGRSLLAMFVIVPIVAVLLVRVFDFRRDIEIALVALAISPIPPLLPNREMKGGGLMAYGLGLMGLAGLLSIAYVPLAAVVLGRVFGQPIAVAPATVATIMLAMVMAPLLAGVGLRAVAPGLAERLAGPVTMVSKVLLVLGALPLLVKVLPAAWALVGNGTVVAIVLFVVAGLAAGHLLGGPELGESVVLALSSACRHPAIAFTIAAANFPDERFGGAIGLYLLVSILVGLPYLAWARKRATAQAAAA